MKNESFWGRYKEQSIQFWLRRIGTQKIWAERVLRSERDFLFIRTKIAQQNSAVHDTVIMIFVD